MRAYVLIKVHTGEIHEAIRQMRQVAGVKDANITFGPYDAVALVDGGDLNAVGQIVASGIQPIPGVAETLTCLVIDNI